MIDLAAISPAAGAKYSPNLHRWLKHHRRDLPNIRAFDAGRGEAESRRIMLGYVYDGDLIASQLGAVLCHGGRAQLFCWAGAGWYRGLPGFFDGYRRWGRCYVDPRHTMNFSDPRWLQEGHARTCLWCGIQQVKTLVPRAVVDERWVAA